MLQRHLDAHDAITSQGDQSRIARGVPGRIGAHLNGECVPTGSKKISPLVWKVNTILL
jgi:hypothetical protein